MYTLRTVPPNGANENQLIGDNYSFTHRSQHPEAFKEMFRDVFTEVEAKSQPRTKLVYGFVLSKGVAHPLYNDNIYYIMSESGKTFDKLRNVPDNIIENDGPPLKKSHGHQSDEEKIVEIKTNVVASFMEHCESEGVKFKDGLFESFFEA